MTDDSRRMKTVHWVALILTIVGALNWGLVGVFQFDLVAALFGGVAAGASRLVYTLVGIAGVALAVTASRRETALRTAEGAVVRVSTH